MAGPPVHPCVHGDNLLPDSGLQGGELGLIDDKKPHDSAYVHSSTKGQHWFKAGSKVAQAERPEKSRGQWILLGLLVIFAVIGGSFLGFIIETQALNPPTQVVGVCPPPAFVSGNDCLQRVCHTDTGNGQQICSNQNAGYIVGGNSTRITCNNGVCVGIP